MLIIGGFYRRFSVNISINVFLVDIQLANGNAFFIFKKIGVIDMHDERKVG